MLFRNFRKLNSLTLREVSQLTGYSVAAISKWERELENMPQEFVDSVNAIYGVDFTKQYAIHHKNSFNEERVEILEYANAIHNLICSLTYDEYLVFKKKLKKAGY